MKQPKQVDDADVDAFIAENAPNLPKGYTVDQKANALYHLALIAVPVFQREFSKEWVGEFARRVKNRVMWMK